MSTPRSTRHLRNRVHRELTDLLSEGGPLAVAPRGVREFLNTPGLYVRIALEYRNRSPNAATQGKAALVTAGVPGAGKSSAIADLAAGYRRIDSDPIKEILLTQLEQAGLLIDRHRYRLADENAVSPGELSGWVHQASTKIADRALVESLAIGENVVIEGTLSWPPLVAIYANQLSNSNYEHLSVLDVEVPKTVAIRQAKERWWNDRTGAIAGNSFLGGRFISTAAIDNYYSSRGASVCAGQAREMYKQLGATDGVSTDIAFIHRDSNGKEHAALLTADGELQRWPGTGPLRSAPLGAACIICGKAMTDADSIRRGIGPSCWKKHGR